MNLETLIVPAKRIRARVIWEYLTACRGSLNTVCFTCGNAAIALRKEGLSVIEISARSGADFKVNRWWTAEEVKRAWPLHFDATSGHLPLFLMARIAEYLKQEMGALKGSYKLPTGSGETLLAMKMAYPECIFLAVQDGTPSTERHPESPLYGFIGDNNKSLNWGK